MYSRSMRDTEINDTSKIDSIVFTPGNKVIMMKYVILLSLNS